MGAILAPENGSFHCPRKWVIPFPPDKGNPLPPDKGIPLPPDKGNPLPPNVRTLVGEKSREHERTVENPGAAGLSKKDRVMTGAKNVPEHESAPRGLLQDPVGPILGPHTKESACCKRSLAAER